MCCYFHTSFNGFRSCFEKTKYTYVVRENILILSKLKSLCKKRQRHRVFWLYIIFQQISKLLIVTLIDWFITAQYNNQHKHGLIYYSMTRLQNERKRNFLIVVHNPRDYANSFFFLKIRKNYYHVLEQPEYVGHFKNNKNS